MIDVEAREEVIECIRCGGPVDLESPLTLVQDLKDEARYVCGCHVPAEIREYHQHLRKFVGEDRR